MLELKTFFFDFERIPRNPVREPESLRSQSQSVGGVLVVAGVHVRLEMPEQTVRALQSEKRFHLPQVDASAGAQPQEQVLVVTVCVGEGFALVEGFPLLDLGEVVRQGGGVPGAVRAVEGVRRRTEPEVGRAVPVGGVVLRLPAFYREVGDLVLREPRPVHHLRQDTVLLGGQILVGFHGFVQPDAAVEQRVLLHGERIGGKVPYRKP